MAYITTQTARYPSPLRRRVGLWSILSLWRSRRHLESLDDRALKDIGLTRAEAASEATRPIWDVPQTWRD